MENFKIKTGIVTDRSTLSVTDYFKEINSYKLLSLIEEKLLFIKYKKGDAEALNQIICSNLRFVVSVAKQYQNQGLSLPDLINEGNLGLIKAAEKFDETRGFKFISYAVWWIRQFILTAIAETGKLISIPANQLALYKQVNKFILNYEQEHGLKPSYNCISENLDINIDKVKQILSRNIISSSLDDTINEEGDTLLEIIADDEEYNKSDKYLISNSLKEDIDIILNSLSPVEKEVIVKSFGLQGYDIQNFTDIGKSLNITPERVRQIQDKAIKNLRENENIENLKMYLG